MDEEGLGWVDGGHDDYYKLQSQKISTQADITFMKGRRNYKFDDKKTLKFYF